MYVLFIILHVLVSLVLGVSVLLQSSKGGGLAGAFGGSGGAPQQLLGSRGMTTLLHKVTIWCGIGFMVTSLVLFMMSGSKPASSGGVLQDLQQESSQDFGSPVQPGQGAGPLSSDLAPAPAASDAADEGVEGSAPRTDEPQGGGQGQAALAHIDFFEAGAEPGGFDVFFLYTGIGHGLFKGLDHQFLSAHVPALTETGAMMGSGGLLVMDESDCMVDIARYFLTFTQDQSCGKCTFCRIGTRRMLDILERICCGEGKKDDLDSLESLALKTKQASLCGLGKTAPNPVLTTLKYFRSEYEAHIQGKCPAKKCSDLIKYTITDDCIGCTICAQKCPVKAIPILPYKQHEIIQDRCTKCGTCQQVCPKDAVMVD